MTISSNKQFVAFSGGKDSTAMAIRMAESGELFTLLFTPTGNELDGLRAHIKRVVAMTGCDLVEPPNRTLAEWIAEFGALPNHRQRWCTRLIKIQPCAAFLARNPGSTLCVGLRADEMEREGMYGQYASYRYPLREYGWKLEDVNAYLAARGVIVPTRTDCAVCPYQRIAEWHALWRDHPDAYAQGEAWERETGHTFRSSGRDSWPASLAEMRAEFERGRAIRPYKRRLALAEDACRVCRF